MKRNEFNKEIKLFSDNEIYGLMRKLILNELTGYPQFEWKMKYLIEESERRGIEIYTAALDDALKIRNSVEARLMELKAGEIIHPSLMNQGELSNLIENSLTDSDNKSAINEITGIDYFGIKGENLIIFRVDGDSMIDENIVNGDFLFIDKSAKFQDNIVGIISIDEKLFVKRIRMDKDRVWLESENTNYKPFQITGKQNVNFIGEVVHCLKRVG